MEHTVIERTVTIHAPVHRVWQIFTDPAITRQMGGYYDTNWQVGGAFGFRNADGDPVTSGILLAHEPEQRIQHRVLEQDGITVQTEITYTFREADGYTVLTGREVMVSPLDPLTFEDAEAGWEFALKAVKDLAEKQ